MPPKTIAKHSVPPLQSETRKKKCSFFSKPFSPLLPFLVGIDKTRQLEVMCSRLFSGMNQLKLHIVQNSQSMNSITNDEDDFVNWCLAFDIVVRLVAYITVSALVVIVFFWIMNYILECNSERNVEEENIRPTETSPLCNTNVAPTTYRTCEEDLELGNRDSSDESDDDLYDGKLCVICYDDKRNCFFVPCGHCATCYDCAKRIFDGDQNKKCPVCRRLIGKVKRFLAP